jgi:hypothetical protein
MFATIKSLIPEPREADQPRHYVGRHRQPYAATQTAAGVANNTSPAMLDPTRTDPCFAAVRSTATNQSATHDHPTLPTSNTPGPGVVGNPPLPLATDEAAEAAKPADRRQVA